MKTSIQKHVRVSWEVMYINLLGLKLNGIVADITLDRGMVDNIYNDDLYLLSNYYLMQ